MLEEKIFSINKAEQSLSNRELTNIFWSCVGKEFENFSDAELFIKVGSVYEPTNFDFQLRCLPLLHSKIHEIDDIKFVSDALQTIKSYRVIDDNVCKKMYVSDLKEGEYILALAGDPLFKIIETECAWVDKPMKFEFYNGRGWLSHSPNYDKHPFKINIELSVRSKEKEKILVKMYNQILKSYKEKGTKEIKSP